MAIFTNTVPETQALELTEAELTCVAGGLNEWQSAGIAVISLSLRTPITAGFGLPIGLAMLGLGSYRDMRRLFSH